MKSPNYSLAAQEAHNIIKKLDIQNPPVDPLAVAKFLGVAVGEIDMPDKFKNVSGFMDFNSKEIILNKEDSPRRKAFTIAHELGHYVLHAEKFKQDPSLYNVLFRMEEYENNSDEEKEANTFAACLLAPTEMLQTYKDVPDFLKAKIFGVSPKVFKYRKHF